MHLLAFDTGPANMVIDALAQRLFNKPYDRDGRLAAAGIPSEPLLDRSAARSLLSPPSSQKRRS